jgi:hypothetical protein
MSPSAILVLGLGLVLALPVASRVVLRRFDPFEPIVLFAVAYGAMFVARPAAMLVNGELSFGGVDLRDTFPTVTGLALAGGVAFLVAYELRPGVVLARRLPGPRSIDTRAAFTWSMALAALAGLALAMLAMGIAGRSDQVGSVAVPSDYATYGARLLVPAALCLAALALRDRSRRIVLAAALALGASLALLAPLGSRVFLLPLLGGIFVFAYIHRRRRPSAFVLLAVMVAALFGSYAAVVVREPQRRDDARAEFTRLLQRPDRVFDLIFHRGDAEMAPVLAGALTAVPDRLGYRYGGATIGDLLVRPIPRQLWQDKPKPGGTQVVATVWPHLSGNFHPAFSPLLSFYWDFGLAGVLGGMAFFGFACRVLYEWFLRHADSFAAQLIFSVALWYVVIGARNEITDTLVHASFVLLPLILLVRFSEPRGSIVRPLLGRARVSQR